MNLREKLLKKYPQLNKKTVELVIKKIKATKKNQRGDGFIDKTVNKAVSLYNKALFRKKDKRDHKLKDGELHALFVNEKGALTRAKFAGPGTDLVGNLKELMKANNDNISLAVADENFVSDADKVSLAHDIRYTVTKDPKEVREADRKFVNKLKDNMKKAGVFSPRVIFNNFGAYAGVRGKMALEDLKLIKKGAFASGDISKLPEKDQELIKNTLAHLEMQGYGHVSKSVFEEFLANNITTLRQIPSSLFKAMDKAIQEEKENPKNRPLRNKAKGKSPWSAHVHAYAKEHNLSYREAIPGARKTYKKK